VAEEGFTLSAAQPSLVDIHSFIEVQCVRSIALIPCFNGGLEISRR
jgi:hypothetical protein